MKFINLTLLSMLAVFTAVGQSEPFAKKKYRTQKLRSGSVKLDGIPTEPEWDAVEWGGGDFIGFQPFEGKEPTYQTKFKILHDDKFLYVAFRAYDAEPDSIIQRMSRRDEFPGDWVEINIDSYHDLRSAFSFTISASGVRGDEFISNNGNNWDSSWNPIWNAKTNIDEEGWTAEVRIPLSQLRFDKNPDKIWGFQVQRILFRNQERSIFQPIRQSDGIWVSGFAELHGLEDIVPQKQIEIAPYTVGKIERGPAEAGNPFKTGKNSNVTLGVDGKIAVTSDLILDFTINPDFGQVEADPSQVRIDGFQNFFQERRPFFIESRNIFDYELTGSQAGGDYDSDLLFYSRRIGSSPHSYPALNKNEYADVPHNTSILGAAKFSGKTKNGWSIGLLESITQEEIATIQGESGERTEIVEPQTNYFVSRIQKDINGGETVIGGILTSVNRKGNLNDLLHDDAFSGGIDLLHYWKNRTYYVKGSAIFSHVAGSKEKIAATQTAFEHLFQRPNGSELNYDPNRTSLTGTGGTLRIGKSGGKGGEKGEVWNFDSGITFRSPELELNDIGFMQTANEINHFTWIGLRYPKSIGAFRSARINYNHYLKWDFSGQFMFQLFNTNAHATFQNNWSVGTGLNWNTYDVSNNALRGGMSIRRPGGFGNWGYINSDGRKKMQAYVQWNYFVGQQNVVHYAGLDFTLRAQPIDALSVSLSAGYNHADRQQDQYVAEATYQEVKRTIVSAVDQNTWRYTLRLNYNITPDLTLQYYGQPFITRPEYSNYGYVIDPLNKNYDDRFKQFNSAQINYEDGEFLIDENMDGETDYTFGDPNFNFMQFRSNLVARWEYKAGSELYLVWSQGNTPDTDDYMGQSLNENLFNNLLGQKANNIFLVKLTYRFLK
ncbi:MAG: carbohydrate binding family 9 domain-containing protein [Cytophagales bacterium]|nr:carbohydrate binding family 9 domain-containing protein [Cytophagales bacterium]